MTSVTKYPLLLSQRRNSMANKSALFICLGNICRSPIAEAVFLNILKTRNQVDEWTVDSAALGSWHVGGRPDERAMRTLSKHEINYNHTVRQLTKDDFSNFDFIFGMDEDNMKKLNRMAPRDSKAKLLLLGDFDPQGERIIRDPYYDSDEKGFEKCYEQCVRSCKAFLDTL